MKVFGFHILSQNALDERLAEARKKAIEIPNKMITVLLKSQSKMPIANQILENYLILQSECNYLRERLKNAAS